jgi:hypothetical protein
LIRLLAGLGGVRRFVVQQLTQEQQQQHGLHAEYGCVTSSVNVCWMVGGRIEVDAVVTFKVLQSGYIQNIAVENVAERKYCRAVGAYNWVVLTYGS